MAGYYFNLPPIIQLTLSQQAALHETKPIALSGGPGTGKSVVSLWRHIAKHQNNKKSLLLTYTTTLAMYLEKCCVNQNQNAAQNVKTALKGKPITTSSYEEVIIDEAQDLPNSYYTEIKQITKISYGADDSQILYPEKCSYQKQLKTIFSTNVECVLDKNFRSTQRIMKFAQQAFEEAFIPASILAGLTHNIGELPIMLVTGGSKYETSNPKQDDAILKIVGTFHADTHNIAILVSSEKQVDYFYNVLAGTFSCTKYYNSMGGCKEIANIHITTFKSAKGLEFDTVIIPNFDKVESVKNYSEEEKLKFKTDWKDFYVGVTRARSNLYLLSNFDMSKYNSVTDKSII